MEDKVSQQMLDMEQHEISDDYKIVGKQGSGGCSVVYDGWRKEDGRHVAIKVLALPESLDPGEAETTKKRFYREAKILSSLTNEHSVRCYDYGVFNGAPCVVLEFVEGIGLDEHLREYGALPFEHAVGIACQTLEALEEAHKLGIIHRDIKPANILIIEESDPPMVRLIDFGIATALEGALGELLKTKLGVVRGTPSYMAPELFTGQTSASPESDIYAVGLVLCECLTGTLAVSGASIVEIAFKQAHESIPIPCSIPECLSSVIRKCCEKNPAERYHSAREVIDDLQRVLPQAIRERESCQQAYLTAIKEGNSIPSAPAPTIPQPSGSPMRAIILAVIAFLVLCAVLGFGVFMGGKNGSGSGDAQTSANAEAAKAEAERAKAEAEAAKAQAEAEAAKAKAEAEKAAAEAKAAAEKAKAEAEAAQARANEAKAEEQAKAQEELKRVQEELKKAQEEQARAEEKAREAKKKANNTPTRRPDPTPAAPPPSNTKKDKKDNKTKDTTNIPLNMF